MRAWRFCECHESFSVGTLRDAVSKCVDLQRCVTKNALPTGLSLTHCPRWAYFCATILRIFATSSALTLGASLPQLLRT